MTAGTVLQGHWLLTGVPEGELRPILDAAREVRFAQGDVLLRQGDPSDGLFLIIDGSVHVSTANGRGDTHLTLVTGDEVLGEMGVLDDEPRSASAVAVSSGLAYFVPSNAFRAGLQGSGRVSYRLLLVLADRLRKTNQRLLESTSPGPVRRRTSPVAP